MSGPRNESDRDRNIEKAKETYWEGDTEKAKDLYEANREGNWADAAEWERNLGREEGEDYVS